MRIWIESWVRGSQNGLSIRIRSGNKILMTRLDGELTDELVIQIDAGMRGHLVEKSPHVHIVDCSAVSKFPLSGEAIRSLASRQPALQGVSVRRFFIMPSVASVGLARSFKLPGNHTTAPSRSRVLWTKSFPYWALSSHDSSLLRKGVASKGQ